MKTTLSQEKNTGELLQLVSFNLGNEEFGVDILMVQEINRMLEITKVPKSPEFVEGVINLRGHVIPIINLRRRFGLPLKEKDKQTRIIVVNIDDKVLGIGKEGSQVKISLFGVGDPTNPTELAKYTLKEYWSDVLNNHHAFLLDSRHNVFFLPGGKGGYVFSYQSDTISLARAIGDIRANRAIYIDDYMYVIGEEKLVVLNENDWQEVNDLDLTESLE